MKFFFLFFYNFFEAFEPPPPSTLMAVSTTIKKIAIMRLPLLKADWLFCVPEREYVGAHVLERGHRVPFGAHEALVGFLPPRTHVTAGQLTHQLLYAYRT